MNLHNILIFLFGKTFARKYQSLEDSIIFPKIKKGFCEKEQLRVSSELSLFIFVELPM